MSAAWHVGHALWPGGVGRWASQSRDHLLRATGGLHYRLVQGWKQTLTASPLTHMVARTALTCFFAASWTR